MVFRTRAGVPNRKKGCEKKTEELEESFSWLTLLIG
jgi:hypothetical protein